MIKLVQISKHFSIVFLLFITTFSGCDETELDHPKSNYFPLDDDSQWKYHWEYGCPDSQEICQPPSIPMVLWVAGDTILNHKTYSKIENEYGILRIVRQKDEEYFKVDISDGTESVFLNTAVPVGGSWIIRKDEFWQHKFIMLKPIQRKIVNGVNYRGVLVVEEHVSYDDGQYEYTNSTLHYYANGIGEILTYYSPSPYNQNGSEFSLLKFK